MVCAKSIRSEPRKQAAKGAWRIRTADRCLSTSKPYEELTGSELFLYFIEAEDGPIKIGVSIDPASRLRRAQTDNPHDLHFLGVFISSAEHERFLHRRLAAHRIRGEWYEPHADVFDALEACRFVASEEEAA